MLLHIVSNILKFIGDKPLQTKDINMKNHTTNLQRRSFLKNSLFGLSALATTSAVSIPANADGLPELTETDPMAISLGYKKDTATVDAAKQPKHNPDHNCANCALYTSKTPTAGTCAIFAGKEVSATGWCTVWAPKT